MYYSCQLNLVDMTACISQHKIYVMIEKQLTLNELYTPLLFYTTQMINPFINSRSSANHDEVERLSANGKIFIKGIVSLL